ncbi:endolytic transglycosylase MltG [Candidatus Cyanaurora vandensis]|uniref:endolytic transglycosylase MltG n=1 Tax=Candidatus Cyanaurora vandensis TaxID=2714958 RepID=UPI00257F8DA6|nr:endolytic transglycosylase MltG [Candidatus Cyanaurora vandensis]
MSRLQGILLAGLLILTLGLGGWSAWQQSLAPVGGSVVRLKIQPGSGSSAIGDELVQAKVIRSIWSWRAYLLLKGWQNQLQAGTYDLDPSQGLPQIAEQVARGRVVQVRFTIPEGWNLKQMSRYFAQQQFFVEADFWRLVKGKDRVQVPWLPAELPLLEGFLYPDTYQLALDQVTARHVVDQMLERFERVALPLAPPSQTQALVAWVTLASIVEREAVVPQERPLIAGVFWSRLQKKIPLGADPTVEYAFGLQQTPDRPLTFKQVRQYSPYNTYVVTGLPPAPIAAPGKASLESAARPLETDYLYFMARYDGTHIFSRTEQEHEQAKQIVRKQRRQLPRIGLP